MATRAFVLVLAIVISACSREPAASPPVEAETKVAFTPRPLRDITVPRTPERVARGRYLAEGLLQCAVCHSERDWKVPGAPPATGLKYAGQVWPGRPWLTAPNLTPDRETGTGNWTDDMLIRAIREGIGHDGRVLFPQMWSKSFHALPDEDVESVVAYLRSLKPIRHVLPKTSLPPEVAKKLKVLEPITEPVPVVAPANDVDRGRRLADLADCGGCHTFWDTLTIPGYFGGGNHIEIGPFKSYSANLTSDDSGIAHYDAAFFREVMRTGKARGRDLSPLMPWTVFGNLSDEDLNALFAYLRALPKVKHLIDNIDSPTKCRICGAEHPLGQYNKPPDLKLVPVPLSELKDAPGTYRFESGWTVRVVIEAGKLQLKFSGGQGCELVTTDARAYFCAGDVDKIEFVRDATGRITGATNNLMPGRKIR